MDKDAEIERLRDDLLFVRNEHAEYKREAESARMAVARKHKELVDSDAEIARLKAALEAERAACERLFAVADTLSRCESSLSVDAVQGHLRLAAATKIYNDKADALSELRQILARRYAERAAQEKP